MNPFFSYHKSVAHAKLFFKDITILHCSSSILFLIEKLWAVNNIDAHLIIVLIEREALLGI